MLLDHPQETRDAAEGWTWWIESSKLNYRQKRISSNIHHSLEANAFTRSLNYRGAPSVRSHGSRHSMSTCRRPVENPFMAKNCLAVQSLWVRWCPKCSYQEDQLGTDKEEQWGLFISKGESCVNAPFSFVSAQLKPAVEIKCPPWKAPDIETWALPEHKLWHKLSIVPFILTWWNKNNYMWLCTYDTHKVQPFDFSCCSCDL